MKNLGYYGRRNICGERVRMARLAKRISQENLAAKMQTLGVNIAQDAISNIEAGRRLVMDYELRAFATVLQVPIEELLEPEEELTHGTPFRGPYFLLDITV